MKEHNRSLIKAAVVFVIVATIAIICWKLLLSKEQIVKGVEYIQSFGVWSAVIYAGLYVILVSLSFPSSLFNLTAGILFSFFEALLVASVAGLAAASVTFLFSRFLLHDHISKKIEQSKTGSKTLDLVKDESAKVIVLLRLNPFIPAVVKNYGLGVTDVKFSTYALFTFIGQLPLAAIYVYVGWIGGRAMLDADKSPDTVHWIMLGLGVLASVITLAVSHRYLNGKLHPATD